MLQSAAQPDFVEVDDALEEPSAQRGFFGGHHASHLFDLRSVRSLRTSHSNARCHRRYSRCRRSRQLPPFAGACLPVVNQMSAEVGGPGERQEQRSQQRSAHGDGQRAEENAGHTGDRDQRQEDDDRRQGRADQRDGQFFERAAGRSQRAFAAIAVQDDVLDDHDGVVDHQAAGGRETAERHHVEALPQQLHGDKGDEERDRNDHAGHQRGAPVAQEHPDDDAREDQSDDDGVANAGDRIADDVGLVIEDVEVDSAGQGAAEAFEFPGALRRRLGRCCCSAGG